MRTQGGARNGLGESDESLGEKTSNEKKKRQSRGKRRLSPCGRLKRGGLPAYVALPSLRTRVCLFRHSLAGSLLFFFFLPSLSAFVVAVLWRLFVCRRGLVPRWLRSVLPCFASRSFYRPSFFVGKMASLGGVYPVSFVSLAGTFYSPHPSRTSRLARLFTHTDRGPRKKSGPQMGRIGGRRTRTPARALEVCKKGHAGARTGEHARVHNNATVTSIASKKRSQSASAKRPPGSDWTFFSVQTATGKKEQTPPAVDAAGADGT